METRLSSEQRLAVEADDPAIVVTASAGAGKTEVIVSRIERLLSESPEEGFQILALSYTVKAADELDERVKSRVGDTRRVHAETIHAFAHGIVRQHGTWEGLPPDPEVLYRDEDRVELLASWLTGQGIYLDDNEAAESLRRIDLARAQLNDAPYLTEYNDALAARKAIDYPAMLDVATRLMRHDWMRDQLGQVFSHVVVDEAQNLTPAQYELLRALLGPKPPSICAVLVGDEKQSIVRFAGADPGLIQRFADEYQARRVELTQNFRSSTQIARVADRITASGSNKLELDTVSAAPGLVETVVCEDERAEADGVAKWILQLMTSGLPTEIVAPGEPVSVQPEEIAVLARTGSALLLTATALDEAGVDYVAGSDPRNWMSSEQGQAINDLIAYRAGPNHQSAQAHLAQTAQAPIDSLEQSTVEGFPPLVIASEESPSRLFDEIESLDLVDPTVDGPWQNDKTTLLDAWRSFIDRTPMGERTYPNLQMHIARTQRGEPTASGVRLLTVHKSQGREFRAVAIVGLNDGQFPDFRQTTEAERKAELHCFYVAVTRASRFLRLSRARTRLGRNGPWQPRESEYFALAREATT